MTKKTRTILFLLCSALFLIITPSVIFYSLGYRFDFETKKISQTGGIYLKVAPKQVEIYLDGKLKKKTDFIFGSALVENLLPKKYKIEIKKENYHSWEKTLEVKEKGVAEAKNVILFPQDPKFNIITKRVVKFWPSPDQRKLILKEESEDGWALKLFELNKNIKSHLIEEDDISRVGADLLDLNFSENSEEIILEVGTAETIKYFSLKLNILPPILTETELPEPLVENVIVYQKSNNDIYYLDKSGYVFKTDLSLNEKTKINDNPLPVKQETDYELMVFQEYIFLRENQTLYQFDAESKSFERFAEPIKSMKTYPDSNKLVYFSDSEIWILYLPEERIFLMRLSEKIEDIFWLNSDYLVFSAGDRIKITEIDNRDRVNVIDFGELKNPPKEDKSPTGQAQLFWNNTEGRLYILSDGNFYVSESLLP